MQVYPGHGIILSLCKSFLNFFFSTVVGQCAVAPISKFKKISPISIWFSPSKHFVHINIDIGFILAIHQN